MYLESEKISGELRVLFFVFWLFCAEDLSFEMNLEIAGYDRKKNRHLLPRDPFPIPSIASNVKVTINRITLHPDAHNQFAFNIVA